MYKAQDVGLSDDELMNAIDESAAQAENVVNGGSTYAKGGTFDENFPLFKSPDKGKVLVYVPRLMRKKADGTSQFATDSFSAHKVQFSNQKFASTIRCSAELKIPKLGYDGHCPICDKERDSWKYAEIIAKANPGKKASDYTVIKRKGAMHTFALVVVDSVPKIKDNPDSPLIPKLDAQNNFTGKVYYYTIAEYTYHKEWVATMSSSADVSAKWTKQLESGETLTPDGDWFVLDFGAGKDTKSKVAGQGGLEMSVRLYNFPESTSAIRQKAELMFDDLAKDFTPAQATKVLEKNQLRPMSDLETLTDKLITPAKEAADSLASSPSASNITDADAVLVGFGVPSAN